MKNINMSITLDDNKVVSINLEKSSSKISLRVSSDDYPNVDGESFEYYLPEHERITIEKIKNLCLSL